MGNGKISSTNDFINAILNAHKGPFTQITCHQCLANDGARLVLITRSQHNRDFLDGGVFTKFALSQYIWSEQHGLIKSRDPLLGPITTALPALPTQLQVLHSGTYYLGANSDDT